METTIVYYTSNREKPEFEQKIRERLISAAGDTPIISVSQKPIDVGLNICIGEKEACEDNLFRQMLLGCQAASTDFVTFAEADTIYHPEYFKFIPHDINKRYWVADVWICYPNKGSYYFKGRSDAAHIVGRLYFINILNRLLNGRQEWTCSPEHMPKLDRKTEWPIDIHLNFPVVSFKTGNGLRPKTHTLPVYSTYLSYFGDVYTLQKEFLNE